MEARETGAATKASALLTKYKHKFRHIAATFHPSNIKGESPGKSSNLAWAARKASKEYEIACRRDVILTSIDGTYSIYPCYLCCTGFSGGASNELRVSHIVVTVLNVTEATRCASSLNNGAVSPTCGDLIGTPINLSSCAL